MTPTPAAVCARCGHPLDRHQGVGGLGACCVPEDGPAALPAGPDGWMIVPGYFRRLCACVGNYDLR
jgi:hypothetical protein